MFTYIRRITRFGWQSFLREGSLNLATIFVITVTVSLFTFLFASQGIVGHLIESIKEQQEMIEALQKENKKQQEQIADLQEAVVN